MAAACGSRAAGAGEAARGAEAAAARRTLSGKQLHLS